MVTKTANENAISTDNKTLIRGDVADVYIAAYNEFTDKKSYAKEEYVKELARITAYVFGEHVIDLGFEIDNTYKALAEKVKNSHLYKEDLPEDKIKYIVDRFNTSMENSIGGQYLEKGPQAIHDARKKMVEVVIGDNNAR